MSKFETYVLTNAKVEWAKLIRPELNKFKPKESNFSINVAITPDQIEDLVGFGIKKLVFNPSTEEMQSRYKTSEVIGEYLKLSRKAKGSESEGYTNTIKSFDRDGLTPFTDLIGNGSTCNVTVLINTYTNKAGKEVKKLILGDVQIVDLIPYESKATGFGDLDMASTADVANTLKSL